MHIPRHTKHRLGPHLRDTWEAPPKRFHMRWIDLILMLTVCVLVAGFTLTVLHALGEWPPPSIDDSSTSDVSVNKDASVNEDVQNLDAVPLPPCPTEDSNDCWWDADVQGNGYGRSFVDVGGVAYYLDTMPVCTDTIANAGGVCRGEP